MGIPLNNQTVRTNTDLNLTGGGILPTPYADEKDPVFEEWLTNPKDYFQFDTTPTPMVNAEGLMRWNTQDGTLDLGMSNGDIRLQIGQEIFVRVKNETGITIKNGHLVYFNGAAADGRPTVDLLNYEDYDKCLNTAGIATQDILDGQEGYITMWGKVRGIDTSTLTEGAEVYANHVPGHLTSSPPPDDHVQVVIGVCTVSDATDGEIFVKRPIIEVPRELLETTGFHMTVDATVSWNRATREFTITPISLVHGFSFYQKGTQYTKKVAETIQLDDVEGIHYVFYNNGVLSKANNLTKSQIVYAIENYAIVAQIYWDADNKEELIVGEERHGYIMDGETHSYVHMVFGPQWLNGMAINTLNVSGDGSADSHAQFGVDAGEFFDDDLDLLTSAVGPTEGLPIFCYDGANQNLRRYFEPGFSVLTDNTAGVGATGRLVYNKFSGGIWSLETVPDDNFVLCHVFSTNDPNQPYIAFVGQTYYANLAAAQLGAESEITPIVNNTVKQEFLPVATIAFQTNSTYANAVKAKAVPSMLSSSYSDWRTTRSVAAASVPGNHNDLAGKQGGAANEYYHLDNTAYTRAITAASAIANGYLTSTDWSTFDGKQDATLKLASINALVFASEAFVKMTDVNTFSLDTTTYQPEFTSENANLVYASPDGAPGLPTFRSLVSADIPALSYEAPLGNPTVNGQKLVSTTLGVRSWSNNNQYSSSVASQNAPFSTDAYVNGSAILIPTGSLKAQSIYRLRFDMTKTAAGTAASVIKVRFGTNGTTADTSLLTFTLTAGSAQIDTAFFDLFVTFRTVGAGTAVITGVLTARKNNSGATQGIYGQTQHVITQTSGAFDSTVAGSYIGVSYNGGLNFNGTVTVAQAELINLV